MDTALSVAGKLIEMEEGIQKILSKKNTKSFSPKVQMECKIELLKNVEDIKGFFDAMGNPKSPCYTL